MALSYFSLLISRKRCSVLLIGFRSPCVPTCFAVVHVLLSCPSFPQYEENLSFIFAVNRWMYMHWTGNFSWKGCWTGQMQADNCYWVRSLLNFLSQLPPPKDVPSWALWRILCAEQVRPSAFSTQCHAFVFLLPLFMPCGFRTFKIISLLIMATVEF